MRQVVYSTQAKRDLKRYRNDPLRMRALFEVLHRLASDIPLSQSYRAHKLRGNYAGCMECHIEGDFLLVWIDEEKDTIEVVRVGSHAELFR